MQQRPAKHSKQLMAERHSEGTGDGLCCPRPMERESGLDPRIRNGMRAGRTLQAWHWSPTGYRETAVVAGQTAGCRGEMEVGVGRKRTFRNPPTRLVLALANASVQYQNPQLFLGLYPESSCSYSTTKRMFSVGTENNNLPHSSDSLLSARKSFILAKEKAIWERKILNNYKIRYSWNYCHPEGFFF